MRKKHTAAFKAKIALEAIKGEKTISEIAHLVFEKEKDKDVATLRTQP